VTTEPDQRSGRGGQRWGFETHCGGTDIGARGMGERRGVAGRRAAGVTLTRRAPMASTWPSSGTFHALRRLPLLFL
jgi:hypothetical protein